MSNIILMDGSIGQELVKRAGETPTPLWSTEVLMKQPALVREVHDVYLAQGATIITTNTYPVLYDRLVKAGLEDRLHDLWAAAMDMAIAARTSAGFGRVAGAIGPLGASYRPDLAPDPREAARQYEEIVGALDARCDLLLIETVSSVNAAEGVLRATDLGVKPVWLSVSVDDFDGTKLRSGEALEALRDVVAGHRVDAVLINCSRPEVIGEGIEIIKSFGKPVGAYGNGFTKITDGFLKDAPTVDALQERRDLGPKEYAKLAMSWVTQGATIVGGCCEVGPDHIAELAAQIRAAGHSIV